MNMGEPMALRAERTERGSPFDFNLDLVRKSDKKVVAQYLLFRPVVDRQTGDIVVMPGYHIAIESKKGYGKTLLLELQKVLSATASAAKKTVVHEPITSNEIVLRRLKRHGYLFTGVKSGARANTLWLFRKKFEPGGPVAFGAEHRRAAKVFLSLLR